MRTLLTLLFSLVALNSIGQVFTLLDPAWTAAVNRPAPAAPPAGGNDPDVIWWAYTNGSGTTINTSLAGAPNGTTDAAWVTGKSGSGYALDFNGTDDDLVSASTLTPGTNLITICFWWYSDDNATDQSVTEYSEDFNSNPDTFNVFLEGGSLFAGIRGEPGYRTEAMTPLATGGWNHYAIVLDNTTGTGDVKIYTNAVEHTGLTLDTNTKAGTANFAASTTLYVGARGSSSLFLNGRIDDYRIYKGELDSTAIGLIKDDPQ